MSLLRTLFLPLVLSACGSFQQAVAPALPGSSDGSWSGALPDSLLIRALERGDLIVLATPVDIASSHGLMTASFQLGPKETWYDVKLVVDSVAKGKLKHAKMRDLGFLPAALMPPPPFGRLAENEIIVQYPVTNASWSDWVAAAPLTLGERAAFVFRKCHYCVRITGVATGRGPYYTASPWVAVGAGSKLPVEEWTRVARLLTERKAGRRR
jgi:hypothetical protein